jgi:fatty acid desaturase
MAYFGHAILLAFHESSHGNLGRLNDLRGALVGYAILVPLRVYRFIHGAHHAYLASTRDLEMWPFTDPRVSRPARVAAAWAELLLGFFYTPAVFVRGVLVAPKLPRGLGRRIAIDYLITAAIWGTVLGLVHAYQGWVAFLACYFVPTFLAGSLQTLRKFTEHLGLLGNEPETAARTIVDPSLLGRALTMTMLNVTHHGAHHRHGALAYYDLPAATLDDQRKVRPTPRIYHSYWEAFREMLPALADPKIGGQWLDAPAKKATPALGTPRRSQAA